MPEELDMLVRQKMQLEIEREALKQEESAENAEKIQNIENLLKDINEKIDKLKTQWELEKRVFRAKLQ